MNELAEYIGDDVNELDIEAMESLQAELLGLLEDENEYARLNRLEFFDPYPFQVKFVNSHASEIALRAANQIGKCESYNTLIETTNGPKKIGQVFGSECEVLTYPNNEPRKVLAWIRKPAEECFRITMADGQWVEVPKGHRILVGSRYLFVSEILQSLPESVFSRYQSSSVSGLSTHASNVRRLIGKAANYLRDCLVDYRLRGVQPLVDVDNVEVYPPLPSDALQRNGRLSRLGDLARKGIYNLCDKLRLPSSLDDFFQTLGQFVLRLNSFFSYVDQSSIWRNQNILQSYTTEYPGQPFHESHHYQVSDTCTSPQDLCFAANEIVSVYSVGFKTLYDMEVEERHNYISGGLVHHNTLSGTAWDAMDLTGRYPEWYKGIKYDRPITVVVGCVNNDKTRDILQKELFGDPIEWEEELGSGWIPLDCIGKIQKKRGVPDAFYNVRIKHYTNGVFDGWSKIVFLAYEMGKATWMAHKADVTHLDEECPMDILEQAARSGIATGGRIRMTFTPENGVTDVVKLVENDYELHTAEWKDVAGTTFTYKTKSGKDFSFEAVKTLINGNPGHLTEEKIRAAAKKIPEHSLAMRMHGIPVLGSGLVFRFSEEEFKREAYAFPDHYKFIDAIDFGGISSTAHPTAYARLFYDPTTDKIGVYDGFKLQGKEIPEIAAHIVMKPNSDIIPVVYPHDGNKMTLANETTRDQYESAGVNMFTNEENPEKSHATNPPVGDQKEGQGGNKIMPGINEMSLRMNDGRFIVFDTVLEFFEEFRKYHMKDGKIVDVDDDFIAAVRYGVMMIRHAVTLEQTKVVFNTGGRSSGGWMSG